MAQSQLPCTDAVAVAEVKAVVWSQWLAHNHCANGQCSNYEVDTIFSQTHFHPLQDFLIGIEIGIDDVEHFLLQCTLHDDLRHVLKQDILEVWERHEDRGGLNLSVQLILFPFAIDQLTYVECHEVLSATFSYIKNSQRQLWSFSHQLSAIAISSY